MWHDTDGHFVENVTAKSPADKAGLRAGDRIIEINGVNIENENAEDVFYRIKAQCYNFLQKNDLRNLSKSVLKGRKKRWFST